MNSSLVKTVIAAFFLLLGKVTIDIFLFADFFQNYKTAKELYQFFAFTCFSGIIIVGLYNYMQRALPFGYAVGFTFFLLFAVLTGSFCVFHLDYLHNFYTY